jgi:hypothetical protein
MPKWQAAAVGADSVQPTDLAYCSSMTATFRSLEKGCNQAENEVPDPSSTPNQGLHFVIKMQNWVLFNNPAENGFQICPTAGDCRFSWLQARLQPAPSQIEDFEP